MIRIPPLRNTWNRLEGGILKDIPILISNIELNICNSEKDHIDMSSFHLHLRSFSPLQAFQKLYGEQMQILGMEAVEINIQNAILYCWDLEFDEKFESDIS